MSDPKIEPTLGRKAGGSGPEDGGLALGTEVAGRYRVLEILGRGGMGVVYRVRDLTLDADVALKALTPDVIRDPSRIASFRQEVKVARMVTHPNVCRIHDIVEADGGSFITMDFIPGDTLAVRLARSGGKAPLPWTLKVLRDVARGLGAAHAAGVVHRDLKPSNVILGENDRAIVTDFGVAARVGPKPERMGIAGTEGYMSPEQAAGAPLDARSDVYSLGVLAYRMLAGELPGAGETDRSEAASELSTNVVAPSPVASGFASLRARLPPEIADFVATCLELDPDARPVDASVALRMLSAIGTAPSGSDSTQVSESFGASRPRRRHRLLLPLAGAAVLVAIWFGRAFVAPAGPPVVTVQRFDASGLSAEEAWIADAMQHLVITELIDAWGIDARAADVEGSVRPTLTVAGQLARTRAGQLRLTSRANGRHSEDVEGASPAALAESVARRIVEDGVPESMRHPTSQELALAGTSNPEAWRLWRRAQTDGRMLRWHGVEARCQRALQLDPEFPLAWMEIAFAYQRADQAMVDALEKAKLYARNRPSIDPTWTAAIEAADAVNRKDDAEAARIVANLRKQNLDERSRLYVETRWAYSVYSRGQVDLAAALLEDISETWPGDAAAFKMLANIQLGTDDPAALKLALRNGERAVALAPDDLAARAILARALGMAGDETAAREHDRILSAGSADEKQSASAFLFSLHMTLGDLAAASVDTRRFLTHSESAHPGLSRLALLDFRRGAFQSAFVGLEKASDDAERTGSSTRAGEYRMLAASARLALGDSTEAIALAVPSRPDAAVLAGIAGHRLGKTGALATSLAAIANSGLAADDPARVALEVAVAHEAGDWEAVVAGFTSIRDRGRVPVLFAAADAYEKLGRNDEALRLFEELASHPDGWRREPVSSVRAWYRVGLLREKRGNGKEAAEAFDRFLALWERATRDLPEIRDARAKRTHP